MTRHDRRTGARTGAALAAAALLLGGCSGSSDGASDDASAPVASDIPAVEAGDDPAMIALCGRMVADGLSPEAATALAEENGYVARIGVIDGEPQPVTMDYRLDRFTFEVDDGVVVGCQYG